MHTSLGKGIMTGLAAMVLSLLIAGCGDTHSQVSKKSQPEKGSIAGLDGKGRLPIEKYLLSTRERKTLMGAKARLVESCMERLGIKYSTPEENFFELGITDRRYGLTSPRDARKNGYHLPPSAGRFGTGPGRLPSNEEAMALFGRNPGSTNGGHSSDVRPEGIPPGGCMGFAERRLSGEEDVYGEGGVAIILAKSSFHESKTDQQVVSAISDWSACMSRKGYRYSNPLTSGEDVMGEGRPTDQEKKVAVIDAECNNSTGLARRWFAVESEIQTKMIQEKRAALARLLFLKQRELALSRKILNE